VPFSSACVFRSARHLIDGIVDDFHGMELVECDLGVGQMRRHAFDEGGAHIDADLGDLTGVATVFGQVIGEGRDGGGVLALGNVDDAGFIDIDEQRDIIVAAAGAVSSTATRLTAEVSARARASST
jgi:hypothetical protein